MSLFRFVGLICDGAECAASSDATEDTAREARKRARKEDGWTYRNGKDFCPQCSVKGAANQIENENTD